MQPVETIEISIEVNGKVHKRNLAEDLKVDEDHINEYLIESPGITAWWHQMYEIAKTRVLKAQVRLDRCEAELDANFRRELEANDEKITDKRIANLIKLDKRYQEIEDELLDLKETANFMKFATEAIKEKRSTLISLSANMRTEFKGNKFGKAQDKSDLANTIKMLKKNKET